MHCWCPPLQSNWVGSSAEHWCSMHISCLHLTWSVLVCRLFLYDAYYVFSLVQDERGIIAGLCAEPLAFFYVLSSLLQVC